MKQDIAKVPCNDFYGEAPWRAVLPSRSQATSSTNGWNNWQTI